MNDIELGTKRYGITAWQSSWGARKWAYVITLFRRDRFKRSGRIGWRKLGFVCESMKGKDFDDRKAALTEARAEVVRLKGGAK